MSGPLEGYRVIELAGIGPGPYAAQLLSDLGAEVICIQRPGNAKVPGADGKNVNNRGKKSIVLDLRQPDGVEAVLELVKTVDVLIEGNRPGVAERLGVGPDDCLSVNPKLVYGRMTGWGQTGPWAKKAGHDINYISITGALHAIGPQNLPPPPPINLVGDYAGGSLFLVNGILAALLKATHTGVGEVVDAAIIDGVNSMMAIVHGLDYHKMWQEQRGQNMLTGSAPFYRCYETVDGEYMAVGCIEPQFFNEMIQVLDVDPATIGNHFDVSKWPEQNAFLEQVFKTKTKAEWSGLFDGNDACVTPVLSYKEAIEHKQISARHGLKSIEGMVHPGNAPVFENNATPLNAEIPEKGQDTEEVLKSIGYSDDKISKLIS